MSVMRYGYTYKNKSLQEKVKMEKIIRAKRMGMTYIKINDDGEMMINPNRVFDELSLDRHAKKPLKKNI